MIVLIAPCMILVLFLFWIGFKLTGAIFKALVWVFILLPVSVILWTLGLACCCTLLLIPVGKVLLRAGVEFLEILN